MREPLGEQVAGGGVAHPAGSQLRRRSRRPRMPARASLRTPRGTTSASVGRPSARPDGAAEHRREPGVALEGGDGDRLLGADRAVRRGGTRWSRGRPGPRRATAAPRRCGRGRRGWGPTTSTPGAVEPLAEGVEQPGGAVQPDRRLAGARGPLHADADGDVAADDLVLLRLDRRDDVAHRAGARPLDLGGEDRARRPVRLRRLAQVLVLEGGEASAVDAEPAPQHDVHRLGGRRPVEGGRDRGPPVDDDRVARLVGDVAAADVEAARRPVCGSTSMRPKKSVVRGSSCSDAMRRASTQPSTSPEIASLALDASRDSASWRIRDSCSRASSRYACSRASSSASRGPEPRRAIERVGARGRRHDEAAFRGPGREGRSEPTPGSPRGRDDSAIRWPPG